MEEEKSQPESPQDQNFTQELLQSCLDAQGYVLFVGYLSGEKDQKGNDIISWKYRRYHFSFDDMDEALKQFKNAYREDILKSLEA